MTHRPCNSTQQADQAFKKAFQFLQYFAVGVEQILMDIILHDGKMWSDVKRVESQLYQVICEVRLGMYVRGVSHSVRGPRCGSRPSHQQSLIVLMIFCLPACFLFALIRRTCFSETKPSRFSFPESRRSNLIAT